MAQTLHIDLEVDEINLILEALGQMPFVRVYQLIGRLQQAAQQQIQPASGADPKV